jgi:hypothetical protein
MSASIAASTQASAAAPATTARQTAGRDLRLDYMRGLALLMIFVDHVSGNRFAALTLQSMGFADAAEVFVFIAGLAAAFAYRKAFAESWRKGAAAVALRVRTLYVSHLAMVAGMILLAALALLFGTGFDIVGKLGLAPLLDDPVQALLRMPALAFLPHYMDILPLYVALIGCVPLIFLGFRAHPLLPLGVAMPIYVAAQTMGINMPNFGADAGWFLNPFAWLLLFTGGATVAELSRRGAFVRIPRPAMLAVTLAAAAYVVFAFLHAAPWRIFPALNGWVAFELALHADKAALSWHRLADIAAKAWLVAVLIPPGARFMSAGIGAAITRAGRNSLPVFVAGTYLSMFGSIALFEAGGHALAHIGVTFGGVAALLVFAWALERRTVAAAPVSAALSPATARSTR